MARQLGALRDALLDAGAQPDLAHRASEELAAYTREYRLMKRYFQAVCLCCSFSIILNAMLVWHLIWQVRP